MHVTVSTPESTQGLVALAVDDETAGMEMLKHRLRNNEHVGKIFFAVDASEALRIINAEDPLLEERKSHGLPAVDVVFADINMPGLTGMEMARVFTALEPAPLLVFVSAHGDEAVNAFDLGAVDYVLKPYEQPRMDKAIERVLEKRAEGTGQPVRPAEPADDEVIAVELAGTTKLVPRAKVRWVEAHGDYARLYTDDGASHLVRVPLSQLEQRWGAAGFVRIHRSYLVALRLISELRMAHGGYQVVIGDEEKLLPVSRRHTRELKDRLTGSTRG